MIRLTIPEDRAEAVEMLSKFTDAELICAKFSLESAASFLSLAAERDELFAANVVDCCDCLQEFVEVAARAAYRVSLGDFSG